MLDEEQPSEPTVECTMRPDGRYVLYCSWPEEPPVRERPVEPASADDE